MRTIAAKRERATDETVVSVQVVPYGTGVVGIRTGLAFFDHLLVTLACHSLMDIHVEARPAESGKDTLAEAHHICEDVGICLGQAFEEALSKLLDFPGNKSGIRRFGHALVAMDDALVFAAVDMGGRGFFRESLGLRGAVEGQFMMDWALEFLRAWCQNGRFNLHVGKVWGEDVHHVAEAAFKAIGQAVRGALEEDPRRQGVPSTKGMI